MNFFRFICFASLILLMMNLSVSADKDIYTFPAYKMMEKLQKELWRSPVAFDSVGKFVYYVKPGKNGFVGATTFWQYDLDTKTEIQISEELKGRFAYPAVSADGKKLVCQFQKGDFNGKVNPESKFNQHVLLFCDLTKKELKFEEIPTEKQLSHQINEMMPIFTNDSKKIVYGTGKFLNGSSVDEFCSLKVQKLDEKKGKQVSKKLEHKKNIEFSPLMLNVSGGMLSLMNSKSSETSVSIFYRGLLSDGKFKKEAELYGPVAMGVFANHPNVKLDASWMNIARFTDNVIFQAGGWNLCSIVKISLEAEEMDLEEILRGTKKVSYMHPCISANGQWIVYEKCNIEMLEPPVFCAKVKSRSVYLRNIETLETRKVADNATMPVFSPDMTKVVCFDLSNDAWTLKVANTGIKVDEQGLLSREDLSKIEDLVQKLGHSDYKTRENAKIALMRFGKNALNKIRQLENSIEDPEIKYRLKEIIVFLNSEVPVVPESK